MYLNTPTAPVSDLRWHAKRLPPPNGHQRAIHHHHWPAWRKTILDLDDSFIDTDWKAAARIAACGSYSTHHLDPETGHVVIRIFRCGHRLCPYCGQIRSKEVAATLEAYMLQMKEPRWMVLTVLRTNRPLAELDQHMMKSFARLKRRPEWKARFLWGFYTKEIEWNFQHPLGQTPEERGPVIWGPHLNVIYDGQYFPQALLSSVWNQVDPDSFRVWIEPCFDPNATPAENAHIKRDAAREVSKYVGKPQHAFDLPAASLREYGQYVKGKVFFRTIGKAPKLEEAAAAARDDERPEPETFTTTYIIEQAKAGYEAPRRYLILRAQAFPDLRDWILEALPEAKIPSTIVDRQRATWTQPRTRSPPSDLKARRAEERERLQPLLDHWFRAFVQQHADGVYAQAAADACASRWSVCPAAALV